MRKMRRVCVSGYFDPLHGGHVDFLKAAAALGDLLIVILNTDQQARARGRKTTHVHAERKKILESIRYVHEVVDSIDTDFTVCKTLAGIRPDVFANGGTCEAFPEHGVCETHNIACVLNVGGIRGIEPVYEGV